MDILLSVEDLAHITGWRPFTIYKKAAAGQIPGRIKLGRSLRFRRSEVEAWLFETAQQPESQPIRSDRGRQ